jgi:hypothetical protein
MGELRHVEGLRLSAMNDQELIAYAREARRRLRAVPQGTPGRDELIIAYRRAIDAVNSRGLEGEI